jgi:hypothetical protein
MSNTQNYPSAEGKSRIDKVAAVCAVLGALSWLPWAFEYWVSPQLDGKIINFEESKNAPITILGPGGQVLEHHDGTRYIIQFSLITSRKEIFVNEVKFRVYYEDSGKRDNGHSTYSFYLPKNDKREGNKIVTLEASQDKYLMYLTELPLDTPTECFATFEMEDKDVLGEWSEIEMTITDYQHHSYTKKFSRSDVAKYPVWDPKYWVAGAKPTP